jgi:hypothetical protein
VNYGFRHGEVSQLPPVIDFMKRLFDIALAVWLLAVFSIPMAIILEGLPNPSNCAMSAPKSHLT